MKKKNILLLAHCGVTVGLELVSWEFALLGHDFVLVRAVNGQNFKIVLSIVVFLQVAAVL